MPVRLTSISVPQTLEVAVTGPGDANRMYILSGTAVFHFSCPLGGDLYRDTLTVLVGPAFQTGQFKNAVATGALASISAGATHTDPVWSVDNVQAAWDAPSGQTKVVASLAVRSRATAVLRMGFQVTVLAKV